ncbi:MAG: MmgE/PrpD family protein [Deltaproteobacteria bacterium]|nr:MmgE/PrpD family protein [Deltaproteobacteria bacterium]
MEITKKISELIWAARLAQMPSEVLEYSKSLMLSALGAMVAGAMLPTAKIMVRYIQRRGGNPEATIMGAGFHSCVENAAMANGTFAHATEYEDDSLPESTSSYTQIPPVLALGEKLKASGKEVLEAFVVGNEVQSRVGIACLEARRHGYLNLSLSGTLGVAAAAAKLLKLDVQRTTMAISLAASQAGGIVRQSGTMSHYLEMGFAGRNGLGAALLAAEGLTSSSNILEAPRGFFDLVTCGQVAAPEDIINNWGKPFRVMQVGIKKYPCCYHMQRIIESAVKLKEEHSFSIEDIERIEVEVNPMLPQVIQYPEPKNAEEAQFSLPHGMAAALLEKRISPESFSDERVRDRAFREMRQKVHTIVHEEWGWATTGWNPIVTIFLREGRKLRKELGYAQGQPPDLLPVEEVIKKYKTCTDKVLGSQKIEESIRWTLELENLDNICRLVDTVAFTVHSHD